MSILNVEIKARYNHPDFIHNKLKSLQANHIGLDHQIDTYFNVPNGRMKLRQGNIENNLIYYERGNTDTPKPSTINLHPVENPETLLSLLTHSLGVKVVVDKKRDIYFIDNVKFHIDEVQELGSFVEIEAIDDDGSIGEKKLHEQCTKYMELLNIKPQDLVSVSYSDLLLDQ